MRAADVAEALRDLPPDAAAKVMAALPFDLAVQVFDEPELEATIAARSSQRMDDEGAGPLIDAMSADQQADLFRELPETRAPALPASCSTRRRARRSSCCSAIAPDTAGGIMTTEFVVVPDRLDGRAGARSHQRRRAGEGDGLRDLRARAGRRSALVHVVSLRDLMLARSCAARRSTSATGGSRSRSRRAPTAKTSRGSISKYNLLAVPVVDEGGHVLGIVTVDDVIDAIVREQTEDVQKFGGMEALDEPYTEIGFGAMIRKRARLAVRALPRRDADRDGDAALRGRDRARRWCSSLFIPLIMSSGGNSGSQATSLIIRALALREIRLGDWWRIALRELPTGLTLGAILGVIGVHAHRALAAAAAGSTTAPHCTCSSRSRSACALVGIVAFGSLAGSMLPFLLKRLGFDPASASAPFVATLVDVTGLVIYFTVALLILRGTLL